MRTVHVEDCTVRLGALRHRRLSELSLGVGSHGVADVGGVVSVCLCVVCCFEWVFVSYCGFPGRLVVGGYTGEMSTSVLIKVERLKVMIDRWRSWS